jgi:hypothetical protein
MRLPTWEKLSLDLRNDVNQRRNSICKAPQDNIDLPAITLQSQFIAWVPEGQIHILNLSYVADLQKVTWWMSM